MRLILFSIFTFHEMKLRTHSLTVTDVNKDT